MVKIKKISYKILSILFVFIFILNLNTFIAVNADDDNANANGNSTNTTNIAENTTINTNAEENNSIKYVTSASTDTWYLGESIRTIYSFSSRTISPQPVSSYHSMTYQASWVRTEWYDFNNIYTADSDYAILYSFYSTSTNQKICDYNTFKIHTMHDYYSYGSAIGYLYYDFYYAAYEDDNLRYSTDMIQGSTAIFSDMIDDNFDLTIEFRGFYDELGIPGYFPPQLFIELRLHEPDGSITTINSTSVTISNVDTNQLRLYVDRLVFIQNDIVMNKRTEYRYTSYNTILHRLELKALGQDKIELFLPLDFIYSSSETEIAYEYVSDVFTITSMPAETILYFLSNSSYFLAIKDVSSQYLQDSFEGGTWQDDWHQYKTFDNIETSTEIVSAGYFSLHLQETTGDDAHLMLPLPSGRYYISFDYYICDATTLFKFAYFDRLRGWVISTLSTSSINRWHKFFVYADIIYDATYDRSLQFFISTTGQYADVYIDDFRIYQSAINIKTISSNTYNITALFCVWDGYQNPPVSVPVTLTMYRRNYALYGSSNFDTYSYFVADIMSNDYGVASYIYSGGLYADEIVVLAYSPESTFTTADMTFSAGNNIVSINTSSDTTTIIGVTNDVSGLYRFTFTVDFDDLYANEFTILQYELKINDTTDLRNIYHRSCFNKDPTLGGSPYHTSYTNSPYDNDLSYSNEFKRSWCIYGFWGTFHETNIWTYIDDDYMSSHALMCLNAGVISYVEGKFYEVTYRNIRIIQAQAYIFQPTSIEIVDYFNLCDFNDNTADALVLYSGYDVQVERGYLNASIQTDGSWRWLSTATDLSIDTTYYNRIVMRYRIANKQSTSIPKLRFSLYSKSGSYNSFFVDAFDDGNWHVAIVNITSFAYKIATRIVIYMLNSTHPTTPYGVAGDTIWIDYLFVQHNTISNLYTNDYATDILQNTWDFSNNEHVVLNGNAYNLQYDYSGGIISYSTIDAWDGLRFYTGSIPELLIDTSYYNVLIIRARGTANVSNYWNFWFGYDNVIQFAITPYTTYDKSLVRLYDSWHTYIVFFNNLPSYSGYSGQLVNEIRIHQHDNTPSVDIEIDYVYLVHYSVLPYQTIQNSVLLESENNDLQYIYNDFDFIGIFNDLSLIPLDTTPGLHTFTIQPLRTNNAYLTQSVFTWFYSIDSPAFLVNVQSFYVSDSYVNTYVTSNYDAVYEVFENDTSLGSNTLYSSGTTISTLKDTTPGITVHYAIKFTYNDEVVWFNTTYSIPDIAFYVESYSISVSDTTVTITWDTSKDSTDSLTIIEDGITKVFEDTTSPTSYTKSTSPGDHYITLIFSAVNKEDIIYSFVYSVLPNTFEVNVQSFTVSNQYVNVYATGNYDGWYYIYENDILITDGTFFAPGTSIQTVKNSQIGVTIQYAIKFIYEDQVIWYNTSYSNPDDDPFEVSVQSFYVSDSYVNTYVTSNYDAVYEVFENDTSLGSNTLYSSGTTISTLKDTTPGITVHYAIKFTYNDEVVWFNVTYTNPVPERFVVFIETFYISDDYINVYTTATYDFAYIAYLNNTEIGSGYGIASGTVLLLPKEKTAGLYNFSIAFIHDNEIRWFNTSYSIYTPPEPFQATIVRDQSPGWFNFTVVQNHQRFWIKVYHDSQLVIYAENQTFIQLQKSKVVGWHSVYIELIHERNFDWLGYPLSEPVNDTLRFYFAYETKLFYKICMRYINNEDGLSISDEIDTDSVLTYLDGQLVQAQAPDWFDENSTSTEYANVSAIYNNRIWIKNSMPIHNVTIKDLWGRTITSFIIDLSSSDYLIVDLPLFRLGFVNLEEATKLVKIKPTESSGYIDIQVGSGEVKYVWVASGEYSAKLYHLETYTDQYGYGNARWVEDHWEYSMPFVVRASITLPLNTTTTASSEPESAAQTPFSQNWWFWLIIGGLGGIALWWLYIKYKYGGIFEYISYKLRRVFVKFGWIDKRSVRI